MAVESVTIMTHSYLTTWSRFMRELLLTLLFGVLITVFLVIIQGRSALWPTFIYVQSISLSILLSAHVWYGLRGASKFDPLVKIVSIPVGSAIGIGIAATVLGHNLFTTQQGE